MSKRIPSNGVDDTANISAALSAYRSIRLEPQTYRISSSLPMNYIANIQGSGIGTKLLWTGAAGGKIVQFNVAGHALGETLDAGLHNLSLDGNDVADLGIQMGQYTTSPFTGSGVLRDVFVTNCNAAGIKLFFTAYLNFDRVVCAGNAGHGLWISDESGYANPNTTLLSTGSVYRQNGKCGLYMECGDSMTFIGDRYEDNGWEGTWVERADSQDIATRLLNWQFSYWEDNNMAAARSAGGYFNFRWDNNGDSIIQSATIERCRFQGTGGHSSNRHLRLCAGRFQELQNEYLAEQANAVQVRNSVASFIYSENDYAPAAYYKTSDCASAPIMWYQRGGSIEEVDLVYILGTRFFYNNAGTPATLLDMRSNGKIGFFGATPVVKQTMTNEATLITGLRAYGLNV